jgi:hypothetical protein
MQPQAHGVYRTSLLRESVCTGQSAREVLFSEKFSVVSAQWRHGVSDGILKLVKIRLRGSDILAVIDNQSPILS